MTPAERLQHQLGTTFVVLGNSNGTVQSVLSHMPEVTLTPAQRELLKPHPVRYPPVPAEPLFTKRPIKPTAQWQRSHVESPKDVCWAVYDEHFAEYGHLYDRKTAVECAKALGVTHNTAYAQHRLWRLSKGWPASIRKHRRQLGLA